jgi:ubiquitin-conjugating enzyme E2 T
MPHLGRLKRELEMLATEPGPGVSAWPIDDNIVNLQAQIQGPEDSPYAEGTYTLNMKIPDRYPMDPPSIRFITPIYHPNIDSDGRICLDTLKMQPQGTWSPSININTLLLTIRLLMAQPNADDGLVLDITEEFKRDPVLWRRKAQQHTLQYAVPKNTDTTDSATNGTYEGNKDEQQKQQQHHLGSSSSDSEVHVTIPTTAMKRDREIDNDTKPLPKQEVVTVDSDGDEEEDEEEEEEEEEEDEEEEEEELTSVFADAPPSKRPRL